MPEEDTQLAPLLSDLFDEGGWESAGRPEGPCPDADTIGALIEGTLPAVERERVEEHIAACERCYEGYATALAFELEEDALAAAAAAATATATETATVLPFETPASAKTAEGSASKAPVKPVRAGGSGGNFRWLATAAALVLVSGSAWWLVRPRGLPSQEETLAHFSRFESVASALAPPDPTRGPDEPEVSDDSLRETTERDFQAGASAFDLELAARAGDLGKVEAYAFELHGPASQLLTSSEIPAALQTLSLALGEKKLSKDKAVAEAHRLARAAETLPFDQQTFAFGRLIEAARLAAGLKDQTFFTDSKFRAGFELWRKKNPRRAALAQDDLVALAQEWSAEPRDLEALRERLEGVQLAYGLVRVPGMESELRGQPEGRPAPEIRPAPALLGALATPPSPEK